MGTHPIFEPDFDCLTEWVKNQKLSHRVETRRAPSTPNTRMEAGNMTILMVQNLQDEKIMTITPTRMATMDGMKIQTLGNVLQKNFTEPPINGTKFSDIHV